MKAYIWLAILASPYCLGQVVDTKQEAVEQGLTTYIPVVGQPRWTIAERMKAYGIPGVSIAVVHQGKLAWAKGYGWADTTRRLPVTTETLFSAGSVSKPVAAVAALQLVEQGIMSLDTPINRYLTSWKIPESDFTRQRAVTLRQLLSHTAGATQHGFWGIQPEDPLPTVVQILNGDSVAQSRRIEISFRPGTQWRYSGGGVMIAQLAVMDQTHKPYADFVYQTVLAPLRMTSSTFEQPLPARYKDQAAWAYCRQDWFKGKPYVYPQQAAAGLYTTPTDLAKFMIELQRAYQGKSTLLSQTVAQEMLHPEARDIFGGSGYSVDRMALDSTNMGLGFFLTQRSDGQSDQYFFHSGQNAGFVSMFMGSLHEGNGVVVMVNENDGTGLINEIVRSVAQVYHWSNVLPGAIKPVRLRSDQLAAYEGTYKRNDELIYLTRKGDHLVQKGTSWRMGIDVYPTGRNTVRFTDYVTEGVFVRDATGKVKACRGLLNGKVMWEMTKIN
ncbi:serine hydrolase domain-containing protein [Spirosoma lituiforme]